MSISVIFLPGQLSQQLKRGHPWVYRNQVLNELRLPSGTWVQVQCGNWMGYGLWDARSPIAVRVFSQTQVPDADWIAQRVHEAWQRREPLRNSQDSQPTSAYRWLFGEGDGVPGIVVDLYNDYAVLQTYAESLEVIVPWVAEGLKTCTRLKGILRRNAARVRRPNSIFLRGVRRTGSSNIGAACVRSICWSSDKVVGSSLKNAA